MGRRDQRAAGLSAGRLASIAAITSVGVNPGECWPARFWVLAVPMLSVGLCCWWTLARKSSLRWIAIALIALTLVNTALFFWKPNDFLDNRQSTKTYQTLFDRFGQLDFGLVLPVEVDDAQVCGGGAQFALGAGLFIVLTAAAARTQRLRWAYAAPAVLLLIACIDLARVRVMEPPAYQAQIDPKRLGIDFGQPVTAGYIQFGHAARPGPYRRTGRAFRRRISGRPAKPAFNSQPTRSCLFPASAA